MSILLDSSHHHKLNDRDTPQGKCSQPKRTEPVNVQWTIQGWGWCLLDHTTSPHQVSEEQGCLHSQFIQFWKVLHVLWDT